MGLRLRFSGSDRERVARDWPVWWEGALDRPMVVLEFTERLDRYDPQCASVFLGDYPMDLPVAKTLDEFIPRLKNTHYLGDSFPRFWPNYGSGIVAAFAGVQVHPAWDSTRFTSGQSDPITDLRVAIDKENSWWRRVFEITRAAVNLWGRELGG
jgi:hypothetical protein